MDRYNHFARLITRKDDELRISWDDGLVSIHKDLPEKVECSNCNKEVKSPQDIVKYEGLCVQCFPEIKFGFPYEIEIEGIGSSGGKRCWERQVRQTFDSGLRDSFSYSGADMFGNNFGIKDIVFLVLNKKILNIEKILE